MKNLIERAETLDKRILHEEISKMQVFRISAGERLIVTRLAGSVIPAFRIAVNETTKELEVDFKDESGMVTYASPSNAAPSDASAASDGWTFTVRNEKGTSLPATGGPGTALYTLCGAALLIVSALMYGFRMRHRA